MSKKPQDEQLLKGRILEAAIPLFNEQGLKFTMDDLAASLSMSKKTIYSVFRDKKELFSEMVDYVFDAIHESKTAILENDRLSLTEKLSQVLCTLGEQFEEIDLSQLHELQEKYPTVYEKVARRLETGWEGTVALLQEGMDQGVLRPFRIPIFKLMMEVTLEQFFQKDVLVRNGMTYRQALDQVVELLLRGIIMPEAAGGIHEESL